MPPKNTIIDGRAHLSFDDPREQRYYNALFNIGSSEVMGNFDISDYDQAKGLAIVDDDGSLRYVLRNISPESVEGSLRRNRITRDANNKFKIEPYKGEGWEHPEQESTSAYWDDMKQNRPEEYAKALEERREQMMEIHLRSSISAMMKGTVVYVDPEHKEYPREFKMEEGEQGKIDITARNVLANPEFPEKPKPPKAPTRWDRFLNTITFGRARREKIAQYKEDLARYESRKDAEMRQWERENAKAEKDTRTRDAVKQAWPDFEKAEKYVLKPEKEQAAQWAQKEKSLDQAEKNLTVAFGAYPKDLENAPEGLKAMNKVVQPKNQFAQPRGFTPVQAAALTHAAMYTNEILPDFVADGTAFKLITDEQLKKELLEDRAVQKAIGNGHIEDVLFERASMGLFTNEHRNGNVVNRAYAKAGQAFDDYNHGVAQLLGQVTAEGLDVMLAGVKRCDSGLSAKYAGQAREIDHIYTAMQEHPDLRQAAVKAGFGEDRMKELEANRNVLRQYEKGSKAYQTLLEGKETDPAKIQELVSDVMVMEHLSAMLKKEYTENSTYDPTQHTVKMSELTAQMKGASPEKKAELGRKISEEAQLAALGGLTEPYRKEGKRYDLYTSGEGLAVLKEKLKDSPEAKELCAMNPKELAGKMAEISKNPGQLQMKMEKSMNNAFKEARTAQKAQADKSMEKVSQKSNSKQAATKSRGKAEAEKE